MCSKRGCAKAFVIFGTLFVIIGVICGFLVPKIIIDLVDKQACIDSEKDSGYEDWVKERSESLVTKLYYWEITNKDEFLYEGKLPKLRERGPYVYKQTTENIYVNFSCSMRSSITWKKNGLFYPAESCGDCKEDDMITVLNPGYIATMETLGGDEAFALLNLPGTIKHILSNFNHSYEQIGNTGQTVWTPDADLGWTSPGFAEWLYKNYKQNNTASFNSTEMKGLYDVLGNVTTLFGRTSTDRNLAADCKWDKNPAQKDCGFLSQMEAALTLQRAGQNNAAIVDLIRGSLCPNTTNQCFSRVDLLLYISYYIQHLNPFTIHMLIGDSNEIVTTMEQKKVALGYKMEKVINPKTLTYVEVPGIVKVHKTKKDARAMEKAKSIYTCDVKDNKKHQWAAYDGKSYVSDAPGITAEEAQIRGYYFIVPRSENANKPCAFSHDLQYDSVEYFVSQLSMSVKLDYDGETTFHKLHLKRFIPSKERFLQHTLVQDGFIDLSAKTRMPSFFSFPHLLYTNITDTVPASFNQVPDKKKHESLVDVEPVTGLLARAYMKLQLNIAINKAIVKVPRLKRPLNISYTTEANRTLYQRSIPNVWGEYGAEMKESDADAIKQKIIGTLGLACGILISLPMLGIIFVAVGMVLIVRLKIKSKANQVSEVDR